MGFLDAILHLAGFLAPAMAVGLLVPLGARIFQQNRPLAQRYVAQAAINFIVCAAVLAAGLWFFGRDGKMSTYMAMVLASATAQWVVMGA
jgi:FtsH-binding integral membrane protein